MVLGGRPGLAHEAGDLRRHIMFTMADTGGNQPLPLITIPAQ